VIYTCYEMIRDCRAGRAEGWSYFAAHYVPVVQRLLVHYFPEQASDSELIESTLLALRDNDAGLFQSLGPAPERAFVSELRQHVLRAVAAVRPSGAPGADIDLETLGRALEPLTLTEKQAVWFETMRYGDADTGRMLRMSPQTVAKVRERANELVRGAVDAWRSSLLADNGPLLGRAHIGVLTGQVFFRCDRRARHLERARGDGTPREGMLALRGPLLPVAGSGGCAAGLR